MNSDRSKAEAPAGLAVRGQAGAAKFSDYLELTKPRLSLLSVLTALVGYLAARTPHGAGRLMCVLIGTSLAAGGVAALNQWMESDTDARMRRTADRPIPTGKVATGSAFVLGWLMCVASLMLAIAKVNLLSALFTLLTITAYLGWYTPAKRWSRWSTEIGAIAGALPPLIGWTAAEDRVSSLGWILFGILFFWQIPHFMAVAWTHRADYAAVRFPMRPVRDASGRSTALCALVAAVLLAAVSVLPSFLGFADAWYGAASACTGAWIIARAIAFLRADGRDLAARKLFLASIAYLPLQLGALVADRLARF